MWVPFFVLWTLPFWILVGVVCMFLIIAVERESPFWATTSLVATGLALWLFGNVNVFTLTVAHPGWVLLGAVGYIVIGVSYSVLRWIRFSTVRKDALFELKEEFLHSRGLTAESKLSRFQLEEWQSLLNHRMAHAPDDRKPSKPSAREYKRRIIVWAAYWPWSLFWWALNDPIKWIFTYIYSHLRVVYQKIADHIWKGVEPGFPMAPEPPPSPAAPDESGDGRGKRDAVTPGMDSSRVSAWDDGSGNVGRNPEVYNPYGGRPAK